MKDPDLARAPMKIWFGHQSVGQDLVNALAAMPDLGMDVVETTDPEVFQKSVFAHCRVGTNGDAISKCRAFARVMEAGVGERVDIAFFKFCYVDVTENTDVEGLFGVYEDTMRELARGYPDVSFVHVTVPLRSVSGDWMGALRRRIGWVSREWKDQIKRHAYNKMLRAAYGEAGSVFDLAAIEATHPDGAHSFVVCRGEPLPSVVPDFTDDGGHLTKRAAVFMAKRLLSCLESVAADRESTKARR